MNKKTKTRVSKKIVIMIIIVTLFNFVMPNFSMADDAEDGGVIFKYFVPIVLAIPDLLLNKLQHIFIGEREDGKRENGIDIPIPEEEKRDINIGQEMTGKYSDDEIFDVISAYVILYSPGTIFAGKIPGLDVNFISPMGDKNGISKTYFTRYFYDLVNDNIDDYDDLTINYGFDPEEATQTESSSDALTYIIWFR